jgi:hypothetical protein
MPPSGTFSDSEPDAVIDLVDRNVVRPSFFASIFPRIDAVVIRPAGDERAQAPSVRIGGHGVLRRKARIVVAAPDVEPRMVQKRLADAGVRGGEPKTSWGILVYEFPAGATAGELVRFGLDALRALGASVPAGWMYEGEQPSGA